MSVDWYGLAAVLFISLLIFCISYFFGVVTLGCSLSQKHLQLANAIGCGLLLGTATCVVIPEGFYELYSIKGCVEYTHDHSDGGQTDVRRHRTEEEDGESGYHRYAGIILTFGFFFQLVLDRSMASCSIGGSQGCHSHQGDSSLDVRISGGGARRLQAVTLGLIVHSLADGFAVGVAVVSKVPSMDFLVPVAIALHKAPAALGLSTFLISNGLSKRRVKLHMLAFASASPITAIVTYISVAILSGDRPLKVGNNGVIDVSTRGALITGGALLFSGGTFLYVACCHVLPEVLSQDAPHIGKNTSKLKDSTDEITSKDNNEVDVTIRTSNDRDINTEIDNDASEDDESNDYRFLPNPSVFGSGVNNLQTTIRSFKWRSIRSTITEAWSDLRLLNSDSIFIKVLGISLGIMIPGIISTGHH